MLTPGFITDAVGLALLFPLTRIPVRALLLRRFKGRMETYQMAGARGFGFSTGGSGGRARGFDSVYDVDGSQVFDGDHDGPRSPGAPEADTPLDPPQLGSG
jgi:UPF0716 family protein affecting phage T7 exclusion